MLQKILLILKLFLKCKIVFSNPTKNDLLIFDGESIDELEHVISDYKYTVLETRFTRMNKIHLSVSVFILTLKNIKRGFFNSYLMALIQLSNPKVIFTFIDNSYKFCFFSSILRKKYDFVALQNGARYEHKIFNELKKKKFISSKERKIFNFQNFLCFGDYEIFDYKKNNQKVKKFIKVGSLRATNFLLSKQQKNLKEHKINDIFLISDVYCWDKILEKLNLPMEESIINLIKFSIKYSKKFKKKIKFATRSNKKFFAKEKNFYKKNLTNEEFEYLIKNLFFRKGRFDTYNEMLKSKVVVGTMSTMLRENIFLGGKSLSCNFTKTKIFEFPIKGLSYLKDSDYDLFENRMNKMLSISYNKYLSTLGNKKNYMIFKHDKYLTNDLVKANLNLFLNSKK